jgi:hypothetical protein
MMKSARSSVVIMGLNTHMILETVVLALIRRNVRQAINRTSRHHAGTVRPTFETTGWFTGCQR